VSAGSVLVAAGVSVAASGVLGLLGRLGRNRWAGVRTSATLRTERAFEVGNRAAAPAVITAGLTAVMCGALAAASPAAAEAAWVLIGALTMGILAVIGGVRGDRAARRAQS
jgi:hypothetical protein